MKYILWLFVSPFVNTVCAQKISGYIFSKNKEALVVATVRNLNSDKATITDGKGYFELDSHSPDDKIAVEYIGYDTQILAANRLVNDTVFLSQSVHQLSDIAITNMDAYKLVKRIAVKSKEALPDYCTYNYYYKQFIKTNGKIKYYSDALLKTDFNKDNSKTYLLQSRALQKIDSSDEKIIGKMKVFDAINLFPTVAQMSFYTINKKKNNKNNDDFKSAFDVSVEDFSDSLWKVSLTPKESARALVSTIWFVNKQDSIIREIRQKLLPSMIGKVAVKNLRNKQYWVSRDHVYHFEKTGKNITLKFIYVSEIKNEASTLLSSFKPFEYLVNAAFMVTDTRIEQQEIPKVKEKNPYHSYETLQSLGKNYTTPFWENIDGIQQTQDEINFFK